MGAYVISGQKGLQLEDIDDLTDPFNWFTDYRTLNQAEMDRLFAQVAAAYRAAQMSAEAVASLPFALVDKGGEDYDGSDDWQNKVGFLEDPRQLIIQLELSLFFNNAAYARMGMNILKSPKSLRYLLPTSIKPITDLTTGDLIRLERYANGQKVKDYAPDDPELVRIWYLDHTTELLPSKNTRARAAMSAAGILYAQDFWVRNFFERGGVKPTLIAMKGNAPKAKVDEEEKAWGKFIRNVSQRLARVFNADALDVKPFGSGIEDLKDNTVYQQALANIAVAAGMPLSLLLANSANYATAQTEYASWFRNRVTPDADFLAEGLNKQVFKPLGLRLEFRPENTDPEQEDEVARSQSISVFMDFMAKCPTYDVFIGATTTFGYELSDEMTKAAKTYYAEKEKNKVDLQAQMNKPPQSKPGEPQPPQPGQPNPPQEQPAQPVQPPAKWVPTVDNLREMKVIQDVAERRLKKGESLDFEYQPHYGGLPEPVMERIKARLYFARTKADIKAACLIEDEPAPGDDQLIHTLNSIAAQYFQKTAEVTT